MSDRPKISLPAAAPARDPRRRPVRGGPTPRPPEPAPAPPGPPSRRPPPRRPPPAATAPVPGPGPAPRGPALATPAPAQAQPAPPAQAAPAAGVRVSKLLTERGLASRREADEWIAAGWVKVDGRPVVLGERIDPSQGVEIDPQARRAQARLVTVLLHKPVGYVSGQAEDGHPPAASLFRPDTRWEGDRSRTPFHPGQLRGLAPAGRLDIDSTGLLVLTQDGRIAKLLIGDDAKVEKEYLVRVAWPGADQGAERPGEHTLARLRHGLELDGRALRPARVSWQNEAQLRFVLREGRKRQIRRMCELVGLEVTGLKRVRIGSVPLGALPPGQWRYLGEHEHFA
jgi:23S rRNA pseudouridine2604 synthase